MREPNDQLRRARERVESPHATGQPLSRQELAELVNAWVYEHKGRVIELYAGYISKLEQGVIRWPHDPDRRAALRAVLGAKTDAELGLRRPRRGRPMLVRVDRQHFIRATLGATVGAAAGSSALSELIGSLSPTPIPSVISRTHIDDVRAAAATFEGWDTRHGGVMLREAVTAQLRYCVELLDARCPDRLHGELFSAVGRFGRIAGWMSFDSFAHDDARRVFRFALSCAEEVDDWELRARILSAMAAQANRCGDPDTALTYVGMALVRPDRLSATQRSRLHAVRGRAVAKLGQVQEAVAAVGLADEEFGRRLPAEEPPWLSGYDATHHAAATGNSLWEVGVQGRFVGDVRERLFTAVTRDGSVYARGRALNQAKLASLVMATGDPAEGVALGGQALDWAGAVHSHRVADNLRELSRLAQPHRNRADVADLRTRIAAVTNT